MSARQSYFKVLVYAALLVALLMGLLQYDAVRQRAGIPEGFRFIPVDPLGVVYTTNLNQSWDGMAAHLAPLFDGSGSEISGVAVQLRELLEDRCIDLSQADRLSSIGIDSQGAAILAGYDRGTVSVVPLVDRDKFARFAGELSVEPMKFEFFLPDDLETPERYRFHRKGNAGYGRLCATAASGAVFLANDVFEIEADDIKVALNFMPDFFAPGSIQLSCQAVFADGSEVPCECAIKTGDFNVTNGSDNCSGVTEIASGASAVDKFTIRSIDVEGHQLDGLNGRLFDALNVYFSGDGKALLVDDDQMLSAALANPERNLELHYDNDDLRFAANIRVDAVEPMNRVLQGTLQLPRPLADQTVHLALMGNENRLELLGQLNLIRPGATVLDRLVSVSSEPPRVKALLASQAAFLINDTHTSYFLRYLLNYVEGADAIVRDLLGNFHVVFDELSRSPSVDGIGLHLIDLRAGFPELAMAIAIDEAPAASTVRRLQQKLRRARDLAILNEAAEKFEQEFGYPPEDVAKLQDEQGRFLSNEAFATWTYYTPTASGFLPKTDALPDAVFDAEAYRINSDGRVYQYLLPPVTDNDLAYRFTDVDFDDKEITDLKNGYGRTSAIYDSASGLLWIGTDAETLKTLHQDMSNQGSLASQELMIQQSVRGWYPKIHLVFQPIWLVDQGLNHAESDIRDMTTGYLQDLDRYRSVTVTINAAEEGGVSASLQFITE